MGSKKSIVRKNFLLSLGFGLVMGGIFPFYASFFVIFKTPQKQIIFIAGCIVAGVLVGLVSFLITRMTILKLVSGIGRQMVEISSGSADLTQEITTTSSDELGVLIIGFNRFISSMHTLVDVSKQSNSQAQGLGGNLTKNMEKVVDAVGNIGKLLDDVGGQVESQMKDFLGTKDSLDQLNHSVIFAITNVLELFNQMDNLTNQLLSQSETISNLNTIVDSISSDIGINNQSGQVSFSQLSENLVESTNVTLDQNAQAFAVFSDMISQIDDIASRTGVLSMNASIEAARSGSHGAGFKVIAQEVRNLSGESTRLAGEIKIELDKSFMQIHESKSQITATQDDFIRMFEKLKESLNIMITGVSGIMTNTQDVQFNYDQISKMLKGIKDSLGDLKKDSAVTQTYLSSLEKSTDEISREMEQVKEESLSIKELSDNTHQQVDHVVASIKDVSDLLNVYKT